MEEMDFYSMKRKRLQSLCKKHGIPANLKNKEMADRLSAILKGKENLESCQSGSDDAGTEKGTFGKDTLNVETSELNSSNGDSGKMVASDIVAGNVDAREKKIISPGKRSPSTNLEERSGFSPKLMKTSESDLKRLESEMKLSAEKTRDDIGISEYDGDEKMQSDVNEEQVDDGKEGLHSAPGLVVTNAVDIVQVASEEFGNGLEGAEIEKLGGNINVDDYVCDTGKVGDEAEKQDDTNSPQGSNSNDLSLLPVSSEKYDNTLVEGEAQKTDDKICVHGGVYNIENKEQVDDSQEGLHAATSTAVLNKADFEQVVSEEFGNYLVEGEVEKLGDNDITDAHEDVCGTEDEKQDYNKSTQGSNKYDLNLLQVSTEESGYPSLEGAHKMDDDICVHGSVDIVGNDGSEADSTCLGTSKGATAEHFLDEVHSSSLKNSDGTPVQFQPTYPLSQVTFSGLNIHQMVVSGTAAGNTECEAKLVSPDSENKGLEFETNLSPQTRDDMEICDVEENKQSVGNKEQVDDSQEALHAAPCAAVMNDVDLVPLASEEFGNLLVEQETEKLGDKTDIDEGVCGTEDEKQDGNNSTQGSNINDLNLFQVSPEESGYPSVEGFHKMDDSFCVYESGYEAVSMCLDTSKDAAAEHVLDEVHSSSVKDSDGTPVQFQPTYPLSQVTSSTLNIHQMVVSEPTRDYIEICDVEENMKSGVNEEQVDDSREFLHVAPSAAVLNNVDLLPVASDEFGNLLVEREIEKLSDKTDFNEGVCGTGKGGAGAEKQDDTNSPQGSNINGESLLHVSPVESGYHLLEGEVKSDDTICVPGGVYNFENSGSEVDTMCLLDTSIAAKDTDGKTDVTMEHFPDEFHSSSFKYSDGISDQFLATYPLSEEKSSDLNIHEMVASDASGEKLESSQKKGLVADPEECIGFDPQHLEASEIKGFEAEATSDPSTPVDIVGTCNMNESMQGVKTGLVAHAEQRIGFSPKHLEASVMKKELENETNFTPKTARDVGTCHMKENINIGKKEQFGSTISKKTLTKRQPLQDLQQK